MAGIPLTGLDPWQTVGAGVGASGGVGGSDALGAASMLAGAAVPGVGWVSLGVQVLGAMLKGDSEQSGAGSGAELNTSGWAVGEGSAEGGSLSAGRGGSLPWWVWPAGAVVAVFIIKKAYQ